MRNSRIALAVIVVIAVIAAGVGAVYYSGYAPAGMSPTVSISSPANGATVTGSSVSVSISSTNFNVPTQGHYHIYLDNTLVMAYSQASTVTFNNVAPGTHTISVYLANPDHSLLNPEVSKSITINVAAQASNPTVSISSPANGVTIQGSTVTVTASATNFNVPADGYYWVYLDNSYQVGNGPTFTFTNVAPGTHTIRAQLYNQDGTPVSPAVISTTVTVTVAAATANPTISIVSPSGGSTVQGPTVTVTLSSSNFNMPTQGYYFVMLDQRSMTGNGPTFTFTNVAPGAHVITAELHNPDGSELFPDIFQTITINVVGGSGTIGGY